MSMPTTTEESNVLISSMRDKRVEIQRSSKSALENATVTDPSTGERLCVVLGVVVTMTGLPLDVVGLGVVIVGVSYVDKTVTEPSSTKSSVMMSLTRVESSDVELSESGSAEVAAISSPMATFLSSVLCKYYELRSLGSRLSVKLMPIEESSAVAYTLVAIHVELSVYWAVAYVEVAYPLALFSHTGFASFMSLQSVMLLLAD
mmetsp:Transcript_70925/g.152818  ORF Transcript_70925/g.152818 Transcript_70925/m.152818 type:complete len:203 (-) Transcript_70925:2859-3467(-)